MSKIFTMPFSRIYPLYVTKLERKNRTAAELDQVIQWLTDFDAPTLQRRMAQGMTVEEFFAEARMNPKSELITGLICGIRVEDIEDPLMQNIRYLDKLVDELAKGKAMEKVLRTLASV
jgi:hypothetical protein